MVFAGFVSEGKTAEAPVFVAPVIAPLTGPNTITISSLFIKIDDSNPGELGIEVEYEKQGLIKSIYIAPGTSINQQLINLSPKTTYNIRARALDCATNSPACGTVGPWSNTIYLTTLVDIPPQVNLTTTLNCPTTIGLEWTVPNRAEDIESFIIQRSFNDASYFNIGTVTGNTRSFYDIDAIPGKTIFYRIYSVNSSGIKQSNVASVLVKPYTGPNVPQNIYSDPNGKTQNQVTIRWENPQEDLTCGSNIRTTYYVMVKKPSETNYTFFREIHRNSTWVIIDGLKPKETIDYRIFAFSDKGLQSQWVGGRDQTLGPPNPPTDLIGQAFKNATGNSSMQLYWKDNANDEDYFTIEYSLDSVNFTTLGKIKFDNTTLVQSPIEEGIKYFYRAKAGNYLGESPYTPITYGITYQYSSKPNAPYGLSASVSGGKVNLKWYDDSNKESNYIIEKSETDNSHFVELKKVDRNTITYSDAAVVAGKTYFYKVKAVNPLGESGSSNIVEIKVAATSGAIDNMINIYPNPSFDFVTIDLPSDLANSKVSVSVFDNANNLVLTKDFDSNKIRLNMTKFNSGMYNVVIKSNDFTTSKKVYKY